MKVDKLITDDSVSDKVMVVASEGVFKKVLQRRNGLPKVQRLTM